MRSFRWYRDLDATPRLLISFGSMILLTLVICSLAIHDLSQANKSLQVLEDRGVHGLMSVDDLAVVQLQLSQAGLDAVVNMQKSELVAGQEKTMLAALETIRNTLNEAEKRTDHEGKVALRPVRAALPAYSHACQVLLQRVNAGDMNGARAALVAADTASQPLSAAIAEARRIQLDHALVEYSHHAVSHRTARATLLASAFLALLLGAVLAFVIARSFSIPLALAVHALEEVALGDLTVALDVNTREEVGRLARALNQAIEKLRGTLHDVALNAVGASNASQELAAAADAIASGAQQQAASLEQTSASMEQITATIRQSADNARQASELASASRLTAEAGQDVVAHAVHAMEEINAASAKISDIISTVDEIAFQTNLLAVNAAIEAARAGEEGRGFAVVATEVRSLAQRSATAAKEIKSLIQDSLRKVEKGTELVNKSGQTLQGIVGSVKGVTEIVNEMAAAAAEQSTGVEQINTAMTQMDQVTQANAAQTEQLSATAQALSEQSLRMKQLVSTFVLGKDGRALSAWLQPAAPPPAKGSMAAVRPGPGKLVPAAAGDDDAGFEEF
jgi:methyl-accepting chemotaxis protein